MIFSRVILVTLLLVAARSQAAETLFVAEPFTTSGSFTAGIEGPACDAEGNVYAVNFSRQQTVGKVTPDGRGEIFAVLPGVSTGNGIRFGPGGRMYVADYVDHNVLRIDPKTGTISVHAHHPEMNQPNDLAIAADGTLFASDPNWKEGAGQLWRIDPDGRTECIARAMGTTNGIEVSPDGKTLFVNESVQRRVWVFDLTPERRVTNKRLLRQFDDHGFDGMRCDVDGNLYVTRHGKGTVVKMSPTGAIIREIDVLGPQPTNICFGGVDGRTAFVTEARQMRLIRFRVDRPGREWSQFRSRR